MPTLPTQLKSRYPSIQSLASGDSKATLKRLSGDRGAPLGVKLRQPVLRQVVDMIMSVFDSSYADRSRHANRTVSTVGLPAFKEQLDAMRKAMVKRKSESNTVVESVVQPGKRIMNDTLRKKLDDNLTRIASAESKPTHFETLMFHRAIATGGMGRMGGPEAAGPGGTCTCPKCGAEFPHDRGVPCAGLTCPECGASMDRETTDG